MEEKLPEKVDVIVLGTGLPEAILASACARSGLEVLHLDRNDFYGAEWSSFTMTTISDFLNLTNQQEGPSNSENEALKLNVELKNQEKFEKLGNRKIFENVEAEWINKEEEETLQNQFRKFSIDLLPKVLLSRGAMVQTLCDSQVSQYAEFKLIDRQLCPLLKNENELTMNRVPCSKGEIFTSPILTMMEKRTLMKFITFCTQWRQKSEEEARNSLGEKADKPFSEFLESLGVSEILQCFIINTIGILKAKPTSFEGMTASCQFMDSVGHFGASPFLFPLYGCGELAQCFCRLAAVFGSLYCLGRPVQGFIKNEEKIVGIIADNQRINCDHVIMSNRYVPEEFEPETMRTIERVTFITDKSVLIEEQEHISLINAAPLREEAEVSRIIEAGFEACTAPKGYYLVHATGTNDGKETVKEMVENIFAKNEINPIWKLEFTIKCLEFGKFEKLKNLIVSPPVDAAVEYSEIIENCKQIFENNWPDRDFLPRSIGKGEEEEEKEEEEKEE